MPQNLMITSPLGSTTKVVLDLLILQDLAYMAQVTFLLSDIDCCWPSRFVLHCPGCSFMRTDRGESKYMNGQCCCRRAWVACS